MMWGTGLQQQTQRYTKNKMTFSIYFQMFFYCTGGSSAPSGEALGSKKSGCCSSFKYFGGVRMWVAPTGNKILKAQQVLDESLLITWDTNKYSAKVLLKSHKCSSVHRGQCFYTKQPGDVSDSEDTAEPGSDQSAFDKNESQEFKVYFVQC